MGLRAHAAVPPSGRPSVRAASLLLLLTVTGCMVRTEVPEPLPRGARIAGSASALLTLLSRLESLRGTTLAREASRLRARIADCHEVVAASPEGDFGELLQSFECAPFADEPDGIRRLRADGDLALLLPLEGLGRLEGGVRAADGASVVLKGRINVGPGDLLGAFLTPAPDPPGAPRLGSRGALLHARFRPAGGLDLASLVPRGGQGDRLFRLKSEIFSGAAFDGAWEAVVHPPVDGGVMPRVAIGLDLRARELAVAGMERFLRDLASTWPVHPVPFSVGSSAGACVPDMRVLPELAPCFVATATALIVGWNAASVRAALEPASATDLGVSGGLVIRFDRIRETDRRLRADAAPSDGGGPPWEHLRLETSTAGSSFGVRVSLVPGASS